MDLDLAEFKMGFSSLMRIEERPTCQRLLWLRRFHFRWSLKTACA